MSARASAAAILSALAVLLVPARAVDAQVDTVDLGFWGDVHRECLVALEEPRLEVSAPETYRLLFLPSFKDQQSIRIEVWSNGRGRLRAHRVHRPRCEHGDVEETTILLSSHDIARVRAAVGALDFWNSPYDDDKATIAAGQEPVTCSDGVASLLEGVSAGKYHIIERDCTWTSKFETVVRLFHDLAHAEMPYSALVTD